MHTPLQKAEIQRLPPTFLRPALSRAPADLSTHSTNAAIANIGREVEIIWDGMPLSRLRCG